MRFALAVFFCIGFIINLVHEIFFEKFDSGLEALLVIGITFGGVWLTWTVITDSFKK